MCKCMNVIIPTPAQQLRSISHVCKCMNVIIPTPAQLLRSISHVCKCMSVTIPPPPHHTSPSVAEHLTCVQVHECHHPHPSPAVAEHLTCVQVHECHHPHPSPAAAEHLTCVQVHECHHPHPTPPPMPLFSCKIHRDHGTVPATNIASENGWLEYDRFLLGPGLFSGVFAVSFRECNG